MKCYLLVTRSETVMTFRRCLIRELISRGHEVGVIAQDAEFEQDILQLGVAFHSVKQDNRGLNPLSMVQYQRQITGILAEAQPDVVFTFMLKPNLFGIPAAKAASVKRILSMVEGAGDVFVNDSLKWKLIRSVVCVLYRRAFRYSERVLFLNKDDRAEFISRGLVAEDKTDIIHGIGVDLERFAFKPVKNDRTFLMVARMLKTKGVFEYCKCARLVKQKYPDAVFNYLGNEGSVKVADIQEYIDDGSVNYLGSVRDVRPYLEDCVSLLLSSYREGLPMSVMEAEAVGRGIITSDNIGCRETVIDGYNGFLVRQKDYETMAEKCIYVIEHPEEAVRMGQNSRCFAEEQFDQRKINKELLCLIEEK